MSLDVDMKTSESITDKAPNVEISEPITADSNMEKTMKKTLGSITDKAPDTESTTSETTTDDSSNEEQTTTVKTITDDEQRIRVITTNIYRNRNETMFCIDFLMVFLLSSLCFVLYTIFTLHLQSNCGK